MKANESTPISFKNFLSYSIIPSWNSLEVRARQKSNNALQHGRNALVRSDLKQFKFYSLKEDSGMECTNVYMFGGELFNMGTCLCVHTDEEP